MVKEVTAAGYEAYKKAVAENTGAQVFSVFFANAEQESVSWCPDCRNSDPVLRKELSKLPDDAVFILCYVGDRPTWKDPNNVFRKELKLSSVPTLTKVGSEKRLEEEECSNEDLVHSFIFT